jgi:diguanylate cyclase (GGDEF)-like protein
MFARRRSDTRVLLVWVLTVTVVADLALAWVTATIPIGRLIAVPFVSGLVDDPAIGALLGVLFWTAIALLGSLRIVPAGGHGVLTFHLPFVVAAIALGGPVAGGWVAMLGSFERREIGSPRPDSLQRSLSGADDRPGTPMPWYGVLHNHTSMTLAAVVAGIAALWVGDTFLALPARAAGIESPAVGLQLGSIAPAFLLVYAVAAAVFAFLSVLFTTIAVVLRDGLTPAEALHVHLSSYRDTLLGEGVMGWLLAWVYLTVGIWAPILAFLLLLALWSKTRAAAEAETDPLSGIATRAVVMRRLDGMLREIRRGGGSLGMLYLDVRYLRELNNGPGGHAGGDILIAAMGERLGSAIRLMDVAGRLGGDEVLVLLRDVADERSLLDTARRLRADLARPVPALASFGAPDTQGRLVFHPEASIGCLLVDEGLARLDSGILVAAADKAMYASRDDGQDGICLATEAHLTQAFGERLGREGFLRRVRREAASAA